MTDSRVAIVAGVSPSTGSATAVALAMKRANVTVAARRAKEGEETGCPIKDAGSGDIFVRTDVTNEKVIRSNVEKSAKTYDGIVYAFDNTGIEEMMTPVIDQKSGRRRTSVFETMKSMRSIRRVGNPAEIAKAAIGLLSDKAFFGPSYTPLVDGNSLAR